MSSFTNITTKMCTLVTSQPYNWITNRLKTFKNEVINTNTLIFCADLHTYHTYWYTYLPDITYKPVS